MKLYNSTWGPFPRRITLYLAAKGISNIEFVEMEVPHQPERWPKNFLIEMNPAHSVPILDTGTIKIGQSIAILEYLEERYPRPNMLGRTPEERALIREFALIFDEATWFFGVWARQGSQANAEAFAHNIDAARIGAERFASKLRVAEAKFVGPYVAGSDLTIADCVGFALTEFIEQFFGVPIPSGCPKLEEWHARLTKMELAQPAIYNAELHQLAYGLPEQTQVFL